MKKYIFSMRIKENVILKKKSKFMQIINQSIKKSFNYSINKEHVIQQIQMKSPFL